MTVLGAIRPDDWNLPLFLHVLGAMVLVGSLVLVAVSLSSARVGDSGAARVGDSAGALRLGYRSLLLGVIPSWIVMRVSAQWIASKEGLDEGDVPGWVDIGFMTSEPTLLLLIAATVCAGIAARRARDGGRGFGGLNTAALVLVAISLLAYVFAIWAMSTKPT
jgi:hypothetical protein